MLANELKRMKFIFNSYDVKFDEFFQTLKQESAFILKAQLIAKFGGFKSMDGILINRINSPGLKFLFEIF